MEKKFSLNEKEKRFCTSLACQSINYFLANNSILSLDESETQKVPKKLLEKKACFVTLMLRGEQPSTKRGTSREPGWRLRGCIGHLQAIQSLYKDIIENSVNAAFEDPRFPALSENEFDYIKIEVSVLTDPIDLPFSDSKDLLKKLHVGKDGLIIRKGYNSATFLPSVWEELPKKEEFLSHLCRKAGLASDAWKGPGLVVQRYEAIKAKEK